MMIDFNQGKYFPKTYTIKHLFLFNKKICYDWHQLHTHKFDWHQSLSFFFKIIKKILKKFVKLKK